jgi:hypothetical protein
LLGKQAVQQLLLLLLVAVWALVGAAGLVCLLMC